MIISGDLLLVVLIISAQAGPFGRPPRPSTSSSPVLEDNDEDHPIFENKSSNVNDREDDVILASDIVNENGNLTESETELMCLKKPVIKHQTPKIQITTRISLLKTLGKSQMKIKMSKIY